MRTRRIGNTRIAVTELGFGCAPLGNLYSPVSDEDAATAVDAAWDAGIRYFDTAPHYGLGLAERRLGEALQHRAREDFVVSTKVGRLLAPNPAPTGSDLASGGFAVPDDFERRLDYSADGVRRSLEDSLTRMGLDRIDIVLVHDPDDHVEQTIREAIPALVELRDQKVIGAVGIGMTQWRVPLRIVEACDVDVVMPAGRWTLADRSAQPLLTACVERGISVLAAAPYNSGLLAHYWPEDGAFFDYRPASAALLEHARVLAGHAASHGTTLPELAMQFPLRHPAVASVVCGMRNAEQVGVNIRRVVSRLSPQVWMEIDALRARAVGEGSAA